MLGFVTELVDDTLTMASDLLKGDINKNNVVRLLDAGVTIYALSEATGIAVTVLQDLIDEKH